jgi:hypothetical protein
MSFAFWRNGLTLQLSLTYNDFALDGLLCEGSTVVYYHTALTEASEGQLRVGTVLMVLVDLLHAVVSTWQPNAKIVIQRSCELDSLVVPLSRHSLLECRLHIRTGGHSHVVCRCRFHGASSEEKSILLTSLTLFDRGVNRFGLLVNFPLYNGDGVEPSRILNLAPESFLLGLRTRIIACWRLRDWGVSLRKRQVKFIVIVLNAGSSRRRISFLDLHRFVQIERPARGTGYVCDIA